MAVHQHAIAPGARRGGSFWPSIAVASAQLGTATAFTHRGAGTWRSCGPQAFLTRRPRNDVLGRSAMRSVGKAPLAAGPRAHHCSPAVARASRRAQRVCSCVARCCRARAGLARDARGRRRQLRPQGERTGERRREQRAALGDGSLSDSRAGGHIPSLTTRQSRSASSDRRGAPGLSDDSGGATPKDEPSDEADDTGGSGRSREERRRLRRRRRRVVSPLPATLRACP